MPGHRVPDAKTQADRLIQNAQANAQFGQTQTLASVDAAVDGAIASEAKYAAGVQAAISKKSYGRGLKAVDREAMKATISAGWAAAYSAGITARTAKIQRSREKLQPLQQAVVDKIATMPRASVADMKARMLANFDAQGALGDAYRG